MPSNHDDFEDNTSNTNKQTFIVKDERAALRMKQEETREAQAKYRAIVAPEREAAKAAAARARNESVFQRSNCGEKKSSWS